MSKYYPNNSTLNSRTASFSHESFNLIIIANYCFNTKPENILSKTKNPKGCKIKPRWMCTWCREFKCGKNVLTAINARKLHKICKIIFPVWKGKQRRKQFWSTVSFIVCWRFILFCCINMVNTQVCQKSHNPTREFVILLAN